MRGFHPWESRTFRLVLSAGKGTLLVTAGGLLTAGAVRLAGLPSERVLRAVTQVIWCAGAFCAGQTAGKYGRRHVAAEGAACGTLLFLVWLCGVVLCGDAPGRWLSQSITFLLSGAVGGVFGGAKDVTERKRARGRLRI
jgi:putative membrane protein (TIGR04086 family)